MAHSVSFGGAEETLQEGEDPLKFFDAQLRQGSSHKEHHHHKDILFKGKIVNKPNKVDEEFRQVLIDFALDCVLKQPKDVIFYAADYFSELKEKRDQMLAEQQREADKAETDDNADEEEKAVDMENAEEALEEEEEEEEEDLEAESGGENHQFDFINYGFENMEASFAMPWQYE